ncbi:methyltransferase domain-containing protein [Lipomyces japonicus]|uniref:methyltransferase domain-containing protein n=1 Tax=Lipomyces japonicus TaxID=56871 RepID=UPI0034CFA18F
MVVKKFPLPESYSNADKYLEELAAVYSSSFVQTLANEVHIVEFFTKSPDLCESICPQEWLQFFDHVPLDHALDLLIFQKIHDSLQPPESLLQFLHTISSLAMPRRVSNISLPHATAQKINTSALSLGMSPKKIHECERMAYAVNDLCDKAQARHVIDLGSGKGYLSRTLAQKYGLSVTAVESVESRKSGAEKLDDLYHQKGGARKVETDRGSLSHIAKSVDSGDLSSIIEQGNLKSQPTALVGLHACGNLSHHALRSLNDTNEVCAVAVVGCCYNLMTERSLSQDKVGYPMSETVEHYNIPLPASARMLACQAPETWTREARQDFFLRHFYRALLQRIYADRNLLSDNKRPIQVGSLRKKWYTSFATYCQGASRRVLESYSEGENNDDNPYYVSEDVAAEYLTKFAHLKNRICTLWTLTACTVAPLAEAIIHLDRYYYLIETGAKEVRVDVVFDQVKSTRNLMVVGIK